MLIMHDCIYVQVRLFEKQNSDYINKIFNLIVRKIKVICICLSKLLCFFIN